MTDCTIAGTKSSQHAAVDLWGCSLESRDAGTEITSVVNENENENINEDEDASQIKRNGGGAAAAAAATVDDLAEHATSVPVSTGDDTSIQSDIHSSENVNNFQSLIEIINNPNLSSSSCLATSKSVQGSLDVRLLRCVVADNEGVGLRIRHGKKRGEEGSSSSITGFISDCQLYNNAKGNVLRLFDESEDDDESKSKGMKEGKKYSEEQKTKYTQKQKNRGTNISVQSKADSTLSTLSDSSRQADLNPTQQSVFQIRWEFERDDPSINLDTYSLIDQSSSSSSWQSYDTASVACLEVAYEAFIKNCSATTATDIDYNANRIADDITNENYNLPVERGDNDGIEDGEVDFEDLGCSSDEVLLPAPLCRYRVNLRIMQQTNSETHYMRAVRRREEWLPELAVETK
jgi:hypothetical protein